MGAECPPQSVLWSQGCSFLFWRNLQLLVIPDIFLWNKFRGVVFLTLSSSLLEGSFRKWNGKVLFLWYFVEEFRNSTANLNRPRQADHVSDYGLTTARYRSLQGKFLTTGQISTFMWSSWISSSLAQHLAAQKGSLSFANLEFHFCLPFPNHWRCCIKVVSAPLPEWDPPYCSSCAVS